MAETQNIVIKYLLDTSEFAKAEKAFDSLTEEEKALKAQAQAVGNELQKQADTAVSSGRKQKRTLEELQKESIALKHALRTTFDRKKAEEYRKALQGVESEMQGITKATKQTGQGIGNLGGMLKGLGAAFVAGIAVDRIFEATKAFAELEKRVAFTRGQIQRFSKTQGDTLDRITAQVRALASTYGIAEEELLKVANAFSKQANIDFVESLNLIEKGYLQVGSASGEFSDSIREYTRLLIEAGATAEEVVKIAAIQDLEGVFNDKLIDSIFNFSNELKDTEKATRALSNVFGVEFAQKAVKDFNSGTATALDILQRVGKEAERTGKSTKQLAEITTDLGTGVTEDLGGILVTYDLYNKALNLNADRLDSLGERQKAVLESSKAYEESIVRLANNFEGLGLKTTEYAQSAGRVLANLLSSFVELFDDASDKIERFKKGLENADPRTFGDDIEATQQEVNLLASRLQLLNNELAEVQEKSREAGAFGRDYTGVISGLAANIKKTKDEFQVATTKLNLLIEAKDKATSATDSFAKKVDEEGKALARSSGIIETLRVRIAELTKAREQAVTEGQITLLNKRIKALQEELQAVLNLTDAKKKDIALDAERLPAAQQVSDDILNTELKNIEELKDARKIAKQDFYQDEQDKKDFAVQMFGEISSAFSNLLAAQGDLRNARFEAELRQLDIETEKRISAAGNNEKAIEQIRKQAAAKEEALLKKQGEARKRAQIQQAVIAGLQGAVQAVARADLFPFNFVLAGLIAATTATQVAAINATPAYKDGTEYVQGKGTETSDSINARLSKGERVVKASTNKQLNGISNDDLPKAVKALTFVNSLKPDMANKILAPSTSKADYSEIGKAIESGFSSVTVNETRFDAKGYSKYERRKNSRVRIIDESNSFE